MTDVTHILAAIEEGDSHAAEQLLPLVYDELRQLAAQKLAQEKPGQTAVERHTPEQWDAYLDQACAGDEALRRQAALLLKAHAEGSGPLDQEALGGDMSGPYQAMTERPGTVIGPYKLLEQIGEGGFGVVYMAEQQQPVRRKVAFKIIKPGMDSKQVIARFEAERQALAMMAPTNNAP